MKGKRVGKKDANTRSHVDMLSKRKPKNSAKNLFAAVQAVIDSLDNQLGYMVSKRPSKPNLPIVPKPSKLLLQQGFSEPCLV